jgi:glycosyltransferase involved in cell wall biosynthesis
MNRQIGRINPPETTRILALMEAGSVTGPAKNLIGFCRWLDTPAGRETGLRISIVTFDRSADATGGGFALAARQAGIDTHVIREGRRFDTRVIPQLRAIVARVNPQIIQTHNGKSHLLLRAQKALRANRLWFAFQHGYQDTDLKLRVYNQIDRLTLRAADRVISVCQAFAPRLVAYGVRPDRIRILHNAAVETGPATDSELAALRAALGVHDDQPVILTIGRLSREKGHAELLRAVALLRRSDDWKLVIVGIGPERDSLQGLAASLGIGERVVFAGFHADVRVFYGLASIFVLPSRSEGSSNVLLEAMMARVPIIATRAGGNAEIIIDGKTGLLVPMDAPRELAEAMTTLLGRSTPATQLALAARERADSEFSVDQYRRRLVGFYNEALTGAFAPRFEPIAR